MKFAGVIGCSAFAALLLAPEGVRAQARTAPGVEFFEAKVRPVLAEHCFSCHGAKKQKGGLRLDSRAAVLKGGDTGPALAPGEPEKSLLVDAVRQAHDLKMPPKEKLPAEQVEALTTWIKMGAPWPEAAAVAVDPAAEARKSHWAFRPVRRPELPAVRNEAWCRSPVDYFILARLEANSLPPSPPADRRTLLRRVTFDLIGLPPTPEEVAAFEADPSPDAFANVVDRLLASPRYGERWARHWLDVARYADTKGYVFQEERRFPYAYTYRDYVIRAFNNDLPYDRFIVEQLAADQLPLGEDKRPLAAMGYLTLGRRFLNSTPDIIDDRIDVVCRGLMALTVGCARCHDHKYDPIPTQDYYSLYGIFASSAEPRDLPLIARPERTPAVERFEAELSVRQGHVQQFLDEKRLEAEKKFRGAAADYLYAAGTRPLQSVERVRRPLAPGELHPIMVRRWQDFLANTKKANHPVLLAWHEFAALPKDTFAARAVDVAARVAASKVTTRPHNPLVARAFAGKPPQSLRDVARRYDELFAAIQRQWQEAREDDPEIAHLPDVAAEGIRQVLYGEASPVVLQPSVQELYLDRAGRNKLQELRRKVEEWQVASPAAPPRAMSLVDAPSPVTPHVFLRGNPGNVGPEVPRRFLEGLSHGPRKSFTKGSGRLELAQAIASKDNPLTARVLVNRVWMHHFGQPLVHTPGDFGLRSDPPTHPELLDYLAARFMEDGWSLKKLHRLILLSSAYQQSSADTPYGLQADPTNRLVWKMNRQRLEFEALRDGLLAVTGRLDQREGGPAVDLLTAPLITRRSVYGFIDRQNLPGVLRTFDFASPDSSTPARHATTVPQQALFLMNSPFVIEQAKALAHRPDLETTTDPAQRIDRLYRLLFGRPPEPDELATDRAFVTNPTSRGMLSPWEELAQVLLLTNEFAYID